jgi:hypothetical protein
MFLSVLNGLVHDFEEGIAIFQPSFHPAEVIRVGFQGRGYKHCQGFSPLSYRNTLTSIGDTAQQLREMFLASPGWRVIGGVKVVELDPEEAGRKGRCRHKACAFILIAEESQATLGLGKESRGTGSRPFAAIDHVTTKIIVDRRFRNRTEQPAHNEKD